MSKIRELLNNEKSVLAFDIDGVLALLEYGEYNHYNQSDEKWFEECSKGINHYKEDKVIKRMQNYLKTKDMGRIYVITLVGNENEGKFKVEFANKYYNILKENVYCVKNNDEKKDILLKIKEKYPDVNNHSIVMIDDTTSVLTDIMENTEFSTVHISSFLDI